MEAKPRSRSLELVKIVARAVFQERDENGRIVGEHETNERMLFTPEGLGSYHAEMQAEVDRMNTLLAEDGTLVEK